MKGREKGEVVLLMTVLLLMVTGAGLQAYARMCDESPVCAPTGNGAPHWFMDRIDPPVYTDAARWSDGTPKFIDGKIISR